MQLQLETCAYCDARCLFCIYPRLQRPKGMMSMALFEKILADAATIPQIDSVTFAGLGETLLDSDILERVRRVRQTWKTIPIDLYTNGHRLTERIVDDLIAAGLTTLYGSLNAVTPAQREQIMGLRDFEETVRVLHYAQRQGEDRMKVIVLGISDKGLWDCGDSDTFLEAWGGPAAQGGSAWLHLEGNWAGHLWPMRVTPVNSCARALNTIMVLWDGRVALCCQDGEGEEILGDLTTQTIREVYNGGRALEVRQAHAEGRRCDVRLCANCASI